VSFLDHTRFQPGPDHIPARKRPEQTEREVVVDVVKRAFQVEIENPQPFRVFALDQLIDGLDRVVTSPTRPETVGARLKLGLAG